jgi:carbamoyltransferase
VAPISDYRPIDPRQFERVLPSPTAAVRIHTIDSNTPTRFARLIEAFGDRTGSPFLVNTSFNGFREPIVCSPRDAVRVFFGTGLDVMFADQFVVEK